jgi:hypothetical protein
MPTTTNFGWTTPADTDLVKDGAAAIRTVAGNIDTSLVDLKGGTTGQVLSKASDTDLDYSWINQSGIAATIVDAKGDLIAATAADTVARLAVGADFSVLQALATETTGLQYASELVSFTPTWTATGSNPAIGNGTLEGKYMRVGKQCFAKYRLVAGSTTTFGSGEWNFSLPFNAQLDGINIGVICGGYSEDNAVAGYRIYGANINTSQQLRPFNGTGISPYNSTTPFSWGNTDYLQFAIVYEVD